MGGEPDDGLGAQDAPGQRRRGVVLADVHAVGPRLEGEVGPVVHDERDAEVSADRPQGTGAGEEGPGLEALLPQLHHVHPASHAGRHEPLEVGPVGRAEVEAPAVQRPAQRRAAGGRAATFLAGPPAALAPPAFFAPDALAAAFTCCLWARTRSRLAASTMSATEKQLPGSP